jgi:hypothetical protein
MMYQKAQETSFRWVSVTSWSTTITAATKLIIINDDTGVTRTSLIFNDLPDGYTLPPVNEAGTQIWSLSYTLPGGALASTTLTFPQQLLQNPVGKRSAAMLPLVQ